MRESVPAHKPEVMNCFRDPISALHTHHERCPMSTGLGRGANQRSHPANERQDPLLLQSDSIINYFNVSISCYELAPFLRTALRCVAESEA